MFQIDSIKTNNLDSFEKLGSLLERGFIRLSEAGIDSKSYYYWKSKKLIPGDLNRKWTQLSGIEYVWIQILKTLQNYNCSVKVMQELHYHLFTKAFEENLANKTLLENIEHIQKINTNRNLTEDEAAVYQKLIQIKNDKLLQNHLRNEISYLYRYVVRSFREGVEYNLILLQNGEIIITDNIKTVHKSEPKLILPINYYICTLLSENQRESILSNSGFINEEEYSIIKAIRNKNFDSITINFEKEERKIKKIELVNSGILDESKSKEIMKILGIKNYASITLKTRNGSTLTFEKKNMIYY